MSPIITPLVMSKRVNCQSKSGMNCLRLPLDGVFGVLDRHARSNSRCTTILEGDVGHQFDLALPAVKRLDNTVVFLSNEAAPYLAGARDFIVVRIELLVEEKKAANARRSREG